MKSRRPSSNGGARRAALDALEAIEDRDAYIQAAVDTAARANRLDPRDRGLALELTMGVMRWQKRIDYALSRFLQRGLSRTRPALLRVLRLAVYQLLFLDRIPDRAAVHTAVDLARSVGGKGGGKFVNGVLRSFLREGESLPEGHEIEALEIRWSHPGWFIEDLIAREGFDFAESVCLSNNTPAPLTIRASDSNVSRAELIEALEAEGAAVRVGEHCPDALHLSEHGNPFGSDTFTRGMWTVQDEASQLIVHLLDPQEDESIWDVCAAPGGKTRYIDALTNGRARILATDSHQSRARAMAEIIKKDSIRIEVHDATAPRDGELFDRVLVDAPCSALGVIRRHPEIRWRRQPNHIEDLSRTQAAILNQAADAVRPGGVLVYSVCTITAAEGREQIRRFLEHRTDYRLDLPSDDVVQWSRFAENQCLRLLPHLHGTDGFFAARLTRQEKP